MTGTPPRRLVSARSFWERQGIFPDDFAALGAYLRRFDLARLGDAQRQQAEQLDREFMDSDSFRRILSTTIGDSPGPFMSALRLYRANYARQGWMAARRSGKAPLHQLALAQMAARPNPDLIPGVLKNRREAASRTASLTRLTAADDPGDTLVLSDQHSAFLAGQSLFQAANAIAARDTRRANIIKDGHYSAKLGDWIMRGPLRGYRFFHVSLEERRTCPINCDQWSACYGNNMPMADRVPTSPTFLKDFRAEAQGLMQQWAMPRTRRGKTQIPPKARGVLIRMHTLGDFYSTAYVDTVGALLDEYPQLAVWIITHRLPHDHPAAYLDINRRMTVEQMHESIAIGNALQKLARRLPGQAFIQFSSPIPGLPGGTFVSMDNPLRDRAAATGFLQHAGGTVCPAEIGTIPNCGTCGLCFNPDTILKNNIVFIAHGRNGVFGQAPLGGLPKVQALAPGTRRSRYGIIIHKGGRKGEPEPT